MVYVTKLGGPEADVISKEADCKAPVQELEGSIEVNLKVHSSSGAYAVNFKADANYQSKNFFTNILRTQLESKFNFATFEAFIGENCVKVQDEVFPPAEIDRLVGLRNDEHFKKVDEWSARKAEHQKTLDIEVEKIKCAYNFKKESETPLKPESESTQQEVTADQKIDSQ